LLLTIFILNLRGQRHLSDCRQRTGITGIPTLPRFSPNCPHCLQAVTGQEYHYPCCLSSPYRELPDIDNLLFFALLSNNIVAQWLKGLLVFSNSNRKVSDKWYMLFSSRDICFSHKKEETGEEK